MKDNSKTRRTILFVVMIFPGPSALRKCQPITSVQSLFISWAVCRPLVPTRFLGTSPYTRSVAQWSSSHLTRSYIWREIRRLSILYLDACRQGVQRTDLILGIAPGDAREWKRAAGELYLSFLLEPPTKILNLTVQSRNQNANKNSATIGLRR